ncbi:hypothetical protein XFF6991_4927 [Xanthomonas phaseoli pv. phaseoli]|uniref:Uncharacterized protein n=1 Tax=Xanthomonas campestris pv. phaseoli TaxID=317013 RepID=A0A7Z7IV92_XANCH|nr:hypothetical protein XFF6991_4927 [Xanthomonas phaseoli pv. phaseoli]
MIFNNFFIIIFNIIFCSHSIL